MSIDYVMPKLAMAMNEGTVAEWLVSDGDHVQRGDQLLTVETEKTAYEVEAPDSGYFRILVEAGETRDCGTVLGVFYDSIEELTAASADSQGQASSAPAGDTPPPSASASATRKRSASPPLRRSSPPTRPSVRPRRQQPPPSPSRPLRPPWSPHASRPRTPNGMNESMPTSTSARCSATAATRTRT